MGQIFNDRVTIYFALESATLSPQILTEHMGVSPDREWAVGSPRGKAGKCWVSHGWEIETVVTSQDHAGRTASELIPIAAKMFSERVEGLLRAAASLGPSVDRYTVLTILSDEVPGIELSPTFLQLLVELGGTFQVDLMVGT
jgi:hypothetical protein